MPTDFTAGRWASAGNPICDSGAAHDSAPAFQPKMVQNSTKLITLRQWVIESLEVSAGSALPFRRSNRHSEVMCMGQDARTDALKAKHAEIEIILTEEERRPFPDFVMVQELKKQKLRVKDELRRVVLHN